MAYFDEVLAKASTGLCLNEAGIFAMGFSDGDSLAGVLGCRRDDIRANAVGGSVIYFDTAQCVGSPAAWITIGTDELTSSREDFRDFFRDRAGCSDTTVTVEPSPCVAYEGCGATPVHYGQHPGGHVWPDSGADAAWAFFRQVLQIDP